MIDRILHNGHIHTFDPLQPTAQALAIIDEKIVAVGSDDEILPLASPKTILDNLNGRFVMPGLVDGHIHWENTAKARNAVDLWNVPSLEEALNRIRLHVDTKPNLEWVLGAGWLQDLWEGRAFPTKTDLDPVTGKKPAYLRAKSGHAAWVNSAALNHANITAETPDPEGGKIERDAQGEPTGILFETAMDFVADMIPPPSPEELAAWMTAVQTEAWTFGLTSIHDFDNPSCLVALQVLRERGELGLRVVKQINDPWIEHAHQLGLHSGFGDNWLRLGNLKIFADGALGSLSAAMIAPYEGNPDNYGIVVTDKEAMYDLVSRASQLGIASTVHAIGDRAVHDVLDIFEAVRREETANHIPPSARRHRIEHVQIIHPDDKARLGQLDIIASMQPIHMASDWQVAERHWGKRSEYSYNWRLQAKAGAKLVFGSDAPIDPFDTIQGIYTAVTRKDHTGNPPQGWYPEAALTLDETLRAYTVNPAYAAGLEHQSGKLQRGFLADLTVLDQNPYELTSDALNTLRFVGTMVGGVWRYRVFD